MESDLLDEAELLLRESVTIQLQLDQRSWMTYGVMALLGETLVKQQKYADGEELLVKAAEGMKRDAASTPANLRDRHAKIVEQLIELATIQNNPDDVKRWESELADLRAAAGSK